MSAGAIMLRSRFADLFASRLAFLDEIMQGNFDAPSLIYPRIFNVRNSSRAYEEITGITGFGEFSTKTEAGGISYDTLLQGYDKRFTHVTYAKGFQISFEAADDDIDGALQSAGPPLARAAQVSIERYIWAVLNGGWATTTTPDGSYLFASSHPLVGGGTASNLVSGDLSVANLETAINSFDSMVDDRNMPIEGNPAILLIPTGLRWIAHEILKSELRSNTSDNATNAFSPLGVEIVMSKYLTDDDSWIVASPPAQHRVLVYWRQQPVTDHTIDFDTGNLKSKMTYRLSAGAADWRNVVGGLGA